MKVFAKTTLILAFGLSSFAALAGEIKETTIDGRSTINEAYATDAKALQHIGVAFGSGKITNSYVGAYGASNYAGGVRSVAHQDIGVADGGTMTRVNVYASYAQNYAGGTDSVATQQIGKVIGSGSKMTDVNIYADHATNWATATRSTAEQKIGVAQ